MARQCTQPKRPRNATWYKEKARLAEAQEVGQILDKEQLVFLADPGVPDGQAVQTIIPNNVAFQTEDLDTYDSNCDDVSNTKSVLMANISNYGSDVILEVPHSETYLNDMENQSVHAMQDFEQTQVLDFTDNEIHSDSNIIPYSQYLQETQLANIQDTNLQAQQDSMILSLIEQMSEQMINHVNNWEKANKEQNNESVTVELERYKERVKTFEQRLNIDLSSHESCDNQNALEILEFFENNDLKAQLQDKDTTICKLKEIIKSIKEKSKDENVNYDYCEIETKNVELENSMAKLLSENEHLFEQAKAKQPLDKELDFACKHAQRIQELLVYVRDTCPNAINLSAKKVVVTPKNKVKKVRFVEPLTSLNNIKHVESSTISDSNIHVLSPTGLKCSTSNYGSKPTNNKKNDKILRTPSWNMKNKVEAQPRKVNKKNSVVEPIRDVEVKHSLLNANYDPICANCKKSMFDGVHDKCLLDFVKNVNSHAILWELQEMQSAQTASTCLIR
ncbi:hypothetical protein Tco_0319495 [Tanacetum coccineum]